MKAQSTPINLSGSIVGFAGPFMKTTISLGFIILAATGCRGPIKAETTVRTVGAVKAEMPAPVQDVGPVRAVMVQKGADGVCMSDRIESYSTKESRSVITEFVGHPGVRCFVCRDREKQHHHVDNELGNQLFDAQ